MAAPEVRDFLIGSEPLQPGERPLAQAKPNVRLLWAEIGQAVVVLGLTLLLPIPLYPQFGGPAESGASPLFASGFALFLEAVYFLQRIVKAFLDITFTTYTLTTDRLYSRTQFVSTDLKVLPYEKVTMVRLRRSLFDRVLGITHLDVHAYGAQEGHVRMRGIVDPVPLLALARQRIRAHNTAEALVRSD